MATTLHTPPTPPMIMPANNLLRDCRPCTACCVHLPIPPGEVGPEAKPPGVPCHHLVGQACQDYTTRPALCHKFRCVWLINTNWPKAWRPDRSGLMCLREEIDEGLWAAAVYETRTGALQSPTATVILQQLQQTTAVIAIIDSNQRRRNLIGKQQVHTAAPTVPAPHFLGNRRRQSASHGNPKASHRQTK